MTVALLEFSFGSGLSREKPTHERHGANRHADAEDDPSEHPLGIAFTEGEHEPAHDDGDEAKAPSDGAGESGLEHVGGVLPGGVRISRKRREERGECDSRRATRKASLKALCAP